MIWIPGNPQPKERVRVGRNGGRTAPRTRAYTDRIRIAAVRAMGLQRPMSGPVHVQLVAKRAPPLRPRKGHESTIGVEVPVFVGGPMFRVCTCTPDLDNIEKAIWDGLNGVVWLDDKQVVINHTMKVWGASRLDVGVQVIVRELQQVRE